MSRYSIYKKLILGDERSKIFNFNNDGRLYYVYRVTDVINKKYYYGSRVTKKENIIEDFWNYGTSSNRKKDILINKSNYKVKIIKIFNNYDDTLIYESFLHNYFDVKAKNNKFFNEANQTPFGFTHNRKGTILSEEHKKKIKENNGRGMYGKKHSQKTKDNWSKIRKGVILSEEHKKKISNSSKGAKKSEEHKKKISEGNKGKDKSFEKNGNASIIKIYNSNNVLLYTCHGNFKKVCEDNILPFSALASSYRNNGKPIWRTQQYKKLAIKNNQEEFIGYYAIKGKRKKCK